MTRLNAYANRIFGDDAILTRLEKLGATPRTFTNLINAGFPGEQLSQSTQWYADEANTPVEQYASQRMAQGYFDDEPLLHLLCRYFECMDWKLEGSPWFMSREDNQRFNNALVGPVQWHNANIERNLGEDRWGTYFLKLPFDLGMEKAKQSLWDEICHAEQYWKPRASYVHIRTENLFGYLKRTLDPLSINPKRFNYYWEKSFLEQFSQAMKDFEKKLEASVRQWQEVRRKMRQDRFQYRSYRDADIPPGLPFSRAEAATAFEAFGLEINTATPALVRRAFRRLSKQSHPDHGGDPAAFHALSQSKEVAEAWLRHASDASG